MSMRNPGLFRNKGQEPFGYTFRFIMDPRLNKRSISPLESRKSRSWPEAVRRIQRF